MRTLTVAAIVSVFLGGAIAYAQATAPQVSAPSVQQKTEPRDEVLSDGAFSYRHAIRLPGYRDLEPSLSLGYSSSASMTGTAEALLGVGWRLAGLSSIERMTMVGGTPSFADHRDYYQIDGEPLLACVGQGATNPWAGTYPSRYVTDNPSASCSAGGNFAPMSENYMRVVRDVAANEFRVTRPDGRIYVYRSVGALADASAGGDAELVKLLTQSRWKCVSTEQAK